MSAPDTRGAAASKPASRWLIAALVLVGVLIFEAIVNLLLAFFFGHMDVPFCASTDVYCSPTREPGATPATYVFWAAQLLLLIPVVALIRSRRNGRQP